MLTADHVLARRRGDQLKLTALRADQRERVTTVAGEFLAAAKSAHGAARSEFEARCADVDVDPRDRRVADGLRKLVTDACEFAMADGLDPIASREVLFQRASAVRRELEPGVAFDRSAVLAAVAEQLGTTADDLEDRLFCDLKSAHRLTAMKPLTAEGLLHCWQLGQAQAVLLRATRVVVEVHSENAAAYRALFHKLKFHRLLFTLSALDGGGYRLEIDGPHSLFRQVTKYGLQLALMLPALTECCAWRLRAEVLWGKGKHRVEFALDGGSRDAAPGDVPLADDLAALVSKFERRDCGWTVTPSAEVLQVPGVGLCVPDLKFTHEASGTTVLFERLGYWSRDTVWKRVELVDAGLPGRVLFAVSDRLRVSEKAVGDDAPSGLLVFKGVIGASDVLARLDRMVGS